MGWPIYTGDAPGSWNRAAAINQAALAAGDWDVAVVADADSIQEAGSVHSAVRRVMETGGAVVPWDLRLKLDAHATPVVADHGVGAVGANDCERGEWKARWNWPQFPVWQRGGTIVISRSAWDVTGGFDAGFNRGWGHEDCAERWALQCLASLEAAPGIVWHLWHPNDPREAPDGFREHRARFQRYKACGRSPGRMKELLIELGVLA